MSTKLDEMWDALEAHKPAPEYAEAWQRMCKERTYDAARAACWAAPYSSAASAAAWSASEVAAWEARWAACAAMYAEAKISADLAIDAIKWEVKP